MSTGDGRLLTTQCKSLKAKHLQSPLVKTRLVITHILTASPRKRPLLEEELHVKDGHSMRWGYSKVEEALLVIEQ